MHIFDAMSIAFVVISFALSMVFSYNAFAAA